MKTTVRNLGTIREAELDLKPLTIFICAQLPTKQESPFVRMGSPCHSGMGWMSPVNHSIF